MYGDQFVEFLSGYRGLKDYPCSEVLAIYKIEAKRKYSRTSRYGHLYITGSFQRPDKILIYFL